MDKNKKKRKLSGHTIFMLILIFILVFSYTGFNYYTKNSKECFVSYTSFLQQVDDEKIDKITVDRSASKIYYTDKNNKFKFHYTTYPATDHFIEDMLLKNIKVSVASGINILSYLPTLCYILLLAGILFYMKNGSDMDIEANTAENNTTTFKDVAGMKEIKKDLMFVAEMMKNPAYQKSGAKLPKGILLEGPPGNGKTLISKAFAGEAGVNFIAVNACDFGSKFVGVGSSKIKKIFAQAKEQSPCVIFIDELDAIGEKRTNASDAAGKEYNTILTSLLNQMDGFEQNEGIIVLAATNRSDSLDNALLRPGRFDKKFIVSAPDRLTRKELFEFATKDVALHEDVTFDKLAGKTNGCSCAEITSIVNEAIINSVKNEHNSVTMSDFEDAILVSALKGHIRDDFEQTERERKIVAYHEAGHAIVSHFFCNKKVSNITIKPTTSGAGGFTITEMPSEDLTPIVDIKNRIVMCYGGRYAEYILQGSLDETSAGASQDISEATRIALNYILIKDGIDYSQLGETGEKELSEHAKQLLKECSASAHKCLVENKIYLDAVAEKLLEVESMDNNVFIETLESCKNMV